MKLLIPLLFLAGCGSDLDFLSREEPDSETGCWYELRCPKTENCDIFPDRRIRIWKCEEMK